MSATKYANLPDIDTAPDIYETDDVFPSSQANHGESSDEDSGLPTRPSARGGKSDFSAKEELDNGHLIAPDEATKRFRKAERKQQRERTFYKYPRSRTPSPTPTHPPSLALRLRLLQNEIAALETEMSDPSNPLLAKDREEAHVDPGDLIKGLVDVKSRLERFTAAREDRARLVQEVLHDGEQADAAEADAPVMVEKDGKAAVNGKEKEKAVEGVKDLADVDRRVGELEKLVGSASASLDETSPMPAPLLPLLSRLNTQLTVLTQPRHLDNISRRLKLLLTDLDRLSTTNQTHRRQQSQHADGTAPAAPSALQEQLSPILTRLVPSLPHIPHVLTRLRTLSALHTSAAAFQVSLEGLEEEQRRSREALEGLTQAVSSVEASLEENAKVVKGNVGGLEERIEALVARLDEMSK
ncbi:hypothetical protein BV25DRAFT_1824074 [Artomyces pyxidatus]|uniref:Uncharacterized protein n=1 Tax=Artomyces pyxidatus TaxID=48021 RepID=A0ACB8T454_9AGAM|nr:hypothetical protein BV25DRAFT_1824074 [Artomyces pyxidatus]